MKFGVREICDVVFKAKSEVKIGKATFLPGQPVLYIDSAKTSTIEGAATTVYAQGGKGNARLIAWEGEKTLTFTVEDALLSPIGFAVLSGAGLFNFESTDKVMVHCSQQETVIGGQITLSEVPSLNAPIFVMKMVDGSFDASTKITAKPTADSKEVTLEGIESGVVFVDYYTEKSEQVTEMQIDADNFAGYYYVEAATLFRNENGKDLPAEITFPKVKIQSNFTFTMASTGDPSTFTFTMDAMPDYTMFDKTKKVMCVMQVVNETGASEERHSVMTLETNEKVDETENDSYTPAG